MVRSACIRDTKSTHQVRAMLRGPAMRWVMYAGRTCRVTRNCGVYKAHEMFENLRNGECDEREESRGKMQVKERRELKERRRDSETRNRFGSSRDPNMYKQTRSRLRVALCISPPRPDLGNTRHPVEFPPL